MLKATAIAAALALAASGALAQEGKPVKTLDDFFTMIVDKPMGHEHGVQTFHADGTTSGVYKLGEFTGTWLWEKNTFCQFITWKGGVRQWNDCGRSMVVMGNKVTITRGNGSKITVTFRAK